MLIMDTHSHSNWVSWGHVEEYNYANTTMSLSAVANASYAIIDIKMENQTLLGTSICTQLRDSVCIHSIAEVDWCDGYITGPIAVWALDDHSAIFHRLLYLC